MKDIKQEIISERDVQSGKEEPNQAELRVKFETESKNREENRREEKRREKIINGEAPLIEEDKNKNGFLNGKKISGKDLNYKYKKGNIKMYNKNNNKRNIINNKKNIYLIIIMIFFNLIISNNNMIEYKFSNVTLKIKGPDFSKILG